VKTKTLLLFVLFFLVTVLKLFAGSGYSQSSDGVKIYYEQSGKGEPLVLIAGGPGDSHAYFKPYFGKLEKYFTIIYFDSRGRGRSTGPANTAPYTVESDVEDLENLRKQLGYETINVFGHSYGGIIAQSYAIHYPDRVRHLILCNTFHSAKGWQNNIDNCNRHIQESYPDIWKKLTAMHEQVKSSTKEWRKLYDPCIETLYWYNIENKKKFIKKNKTIQTDKDEFSEPVYCSMIGDDPDFEVSGTMKELDLKGDLKKIDKPTLILTGRADKIATTLQAVEIQELIPKAKLHIFDASGHLPFVEENASFSKIVERFILGDKRKSKKGGE
jgi:proline iminopeptidase